MLLFEYVKVGDSDTGNCCEVYLLDVLGVLIVPLCVPQLQILLLEVYQTKLDLNVLFDVRGKCFVLGCALDKLPLDYVVLLS